jgi:hypothetical protein
VHARGACEQLRGTPRAQSAAILIKIALTRAAKWRVFVCVSAIRERGRAASSYLHIKTHKCDYVLFGLCWSKPGIFMFITLSLATRGYWSKFRCSSMFYSNKIKIRFPLTKIGNQRKALAQKEKQPQFEYYLAASLQSTPEIFYGKSLLYLKCAPSLKLIKSSALVGRHSSVARRPFTSRVQRACCIRDGINTLVGCYSHLC